MSSLTQEEQNEYARLWRWANPDKVKITRRRNRIKCRETDRIYERAYRKAHPEIYTESARRYRRNNPEKRREQDRIKFARRRINNPTYRTLENLRSRINSALKGLNKSARTVELLGCSIEDFRIYLETKFEVGMSWANYGGKRGQWSIDHIIPCALFDLSKPEHQRRCFHFSNMQPMWAIQNREKCAKIDVPQMRLL